MHLLAYIVMLFVAIYRLATDRKLRRPDNAVIFWKGKFLSETYFDEKVAIFATGIIEGREKSTVKKHQNIPKPVSTPPAQRPSKLIGD